MDNERRLNSINKKRPYDASQVFKWRFNSEDSFIDATHAAVYLDEYPSGKRVWVWEGWTGSFDTDDIFFYDFTIPYINDEPIDRQFEMGKDGLTFAHVFWLPNDQLGAVSAQSAIVHIKFDPETGVSVGAFEAEFLGIHRSPKGKFSLKRGVGDA
ncbi:hypothetical protein [Pseudomonas sp. LB3P31]